MAKHIWMIAYTNYSTDARVRREAEAVASVGGYAVHLMVLREGNKPKVYVHDGVEVHELNVAKYRGGSMLQYLISYVRFLMRAFFKCSQLSWRGSVDLVHVHNMPNFLVFAAILPRCLGAKIVLDVHDTLIETHATKFRGLLSKIVTAALVIEEYVCCKFASRVICVNDIQRDAVLNRGVVREKTLVLMNLPDPAKFQMEKVVYGASDGIVKIVYFGTITHRLGVDLLLRALHDARKVVPGLRCFVYGDGDKRQECVELSKELGLDDIVQFSNGAVPFDELIQKIRGMDLVVIPNRHNTATELMLPVKMLEGMAMGIPAVVPRLKTIEHYFAADQVFYYTSEDISSLTEAILRACRDTTERLRKAANACQFFEKYSWNSQKQDLFQLYRSLVRDAV